jgi:hypothetical protein
MPIFRQANIKTECDQCKRLFSVTRGGVCSRCRRILCDAHLHGSFAQRMKVDLFGGTAVCVQCRSGGA